MATQSCQKATALLEQKDYQGALSTVESARQKIARINASLEVSTLVRKTYQSVAQAILGPKNEVDHFVTPEGKLTAPLITVLQADGLYDEKDSFQQAAEKARKGWQISTPEVCLKQKSEEVLKNAFQSFIEMGLFAQRLPSLPFYDYCVVKVSPLLDTGISIGMMCQKWTKENIHFGSVVFLIIGNQEEQGKLVAQVKIEMTKLQKDPNLSQDLKDLLNAKVTFVQAKSLNDTYTEWMKMNPVAGTILTLVKDSSTKAIEHITASVTLKDFVVDTVTLAEITAEKYTKDLAIATHIIVVRCMELIVKNNLVPVLPPPVELPKEEKPQGVGPSTPAAKSSKEEEVPSAADSPKNEELSSGASVDSPKKDEQPSTAEKPSKVVTTLTPARVNPWSRVFFVLGGLGVVGGIFAWFFRSKVNVQKADS